MRPARLATATWNTSLARSIATVVASMTSPPGYPADVCQRPRAMMLENREESMPSVFRKSLAEKYWISDRDGRRSQALAPVGSRRDHAARGFSVDAMPTRAQRIQPTTMNNVYLACLNCRAYVDAGY